MSTPMELQINTRIVAVLNTITVAAGYNTDVASVKNTDLVSWEEVAGEDMPVLFPYPGRSQGEPIAIGSDPEWFADMDYLITGYMNHADGTTKLIEAAEFRQDVMKAVLNDTTLNGLIHGFTRVETLHDEGTVENISWFEMRIKMEYQYSQSDGG